MIKANFIMANTIRALNVVTHGVRSGLNAIYEIVYNRYLATDGYYKTSDGSYYNVKQKVKK